MLIYIIQMFNASEIANFWPYKSFVQKPEAQVIYLAHDSRKLYHPSKTLFAAIAGFKNDGHQYIADALKLGVDNFIIEDEAFAEPIMKAGANYFIAPSGIEGLQLLATKRREKWKGTMIALTGSNGKTITKEWTYHLIENKAKVYRSPKSYNSQLGVALSIWNLPDHADFAIIEAGISKAGEMEKLEKIIQPDFGLITNIGSAHQENFDSLEQKIDEKLILFKNCKGFFFPESDRFLSNYVKKINPANTLSIEKYLEEKLSTAIPEMEKAEMQNVHAAVLLAELCNSKLAYINENINTLPQISMRLEIKEGKNHSTLLCDYYNADFESLNVALAALKAQKNHSKKWLILSDIEEVGMQPAVRTQRLAEMIKQVDYDQLILISPVFNENFLLLPKGSIVFNTVEDFLSSALAQCPSDATVLLKGARSFAFERIAEKFEQKQHNTRLEVNLESLVHNVSVYRNMLNAETKIMAMVKAFAYGSGNREIAAKLQYHNIDYLAVAYVDEGVELRQQGIHIPIMVMNPDPFSFENVLEYNLEAEIYSLRQLELFSQTCRSSGSQASIHLKIDTGMHRLGFTDELEKAIELLQENPQIKVKSIYTHLAASDDPEHDEFTHEQAKKFINAFKLFEKKMGYMPMKHVLNTAGIIRFPEYQFDMVRLGLGLYGVDISDSIQKSLEFPLKLSTHVSQIKVIKKGESIGYARAGKAEKDMKIATLSIGYADGIPRSLSKGKYAFTIKGKNAPIVGNVCMDMLMIDISEINIKEGDGVVIFDSAKEIKKMAESQNTIPYEVLTNISSRVKRVYLNEL